jgi:flagellar M-ring protein FliF
MGSVQGLLEFAKTLGAPRIAAMVAVSVALVGFFAFLILRVTAPQMTTLFTDLSYEDSAAIIKELDRQGVAYELRNDGNVVMVPKDRVARLRMSLAGDGLPKGGGIGYEIFDKSDALGTTSFVQNINNLRALEGELSRTIRGLDSVVAARVHLVLPERLCSPAAKSSHPRQSCLRSAARWRNHQSRESVMRGAPGLAKKE